MFLKTKCFILIVLFMVPKISLCQYAPNKRDSGWIPLFNGTDLNGLFVRYNGGAKDADPNNVVSVRDSMIVFYDGFLYKDGPANNYGVLSTQKEYSYYNSRVQFKHGDYTDRDNSGWLRGDPYNSGFFYHAKDNKDNSWPPSIECQLKRHWNAAQNQPCSATAGDCDRIWAGDFWILGGAQIEKDGQKTNLGGCCNPMLVDRNIHPDYELEGWNDMEIQVWSDSHFVNIFNGQAINYGSNSTWSNLQNQRVPLTEGYIQLELEGSEIMFKNWEIKLMPEDPLYDSVYTEGCMDPEFAEYNSSANLHVQNLCKTVDIKPRISKNWNLINLHRDYIYNPTGDIVKVLIVNTRGKKLKDFMLAEQKLNWKKNLNPGLYFIRATNRDKTQMTSVLVY